MKIDNNGYKRGKLNHSDLIHRQVAYKEIYLQNKDKYPMPFSEYQVHHIDQNKQNNDISNLMLLSKEDHEKIHNIHPENPILEYIRKNDLSPWEAKKFIAGITGDFYVIRLLIGHKSTDIIWVALKWSFFISLGWAVVLLITGIFTSYEIVANMFKYILIPLVILGFSIALISILACVGFIWHHLGNLIEDTKKAFKRK